MEERSLDQIIADVIQRRCDEGPADEETLYNLILEDRDIRLILDGYRMHDRAEGLEDVIRRDIRRRLDDALHKPN